MKNEQPNLDAASMFEFDSKGYTRLRGLIDARLIAELRDAAKPYRRDHYMQASQLIEKHPAFYKCIFHPAIEAISAQFFGPEFTIKGSVLVINPAKIGGTEGMKLPAWHYDAGHGAHSYYQTAWPCPLFQLRFFVALSDTTEAHSGGLALYPGSHRAKAAFPFNKEPGASLLSATGLPPGAEVVTCEAGDCMIMHQAVWHTALKNTSEHDRLNFQVLTTPNWIRSKEHEAISAGFLAQMEPAHQRRLCYPQW